MIGPSRRPLRRLLPPVLGAVLIATVLVPAAPGTPAVAAPSCAAFNADLYDSATSAGAQLMTTDFGTARNGVASGFRTARAQQFTAATRTGTSIAAVRRFTKGADVHYSLDAAEQKAMRANGWTDRGVAFHAGTSAASCLVAVRSYYKSGAHRFTTSASEIAALKKAGFKEEKVRFYLGRPAAIGVDCTALNRTLHTRTAGTTGAQQLTVRIDSVASELASFGTAQAPLGAAALSSGTRLRPVRMLSKGSDRRYTVDPVEVGRLKADGWSDRWTAFHAPATSGSCTRPVISWTRSGIHRYSTSDAQATALAAAGWTRGSTAFHLGSPDRMRSFTLAVLPDSQDQVLNGRTTLRSATQWLADNEDTLGLQAVLHTGDVVNWDTSNHDQYVTARSAQRVLAGKVPYLWAIGNHDTQATCPGGSACPTGTGQKYPSTKAAQRATQVFNDYLRPDSGWTAFETDASGDRKVDNSYLTFTAGGTRWLVLQLEFMPRTSALDWAERVVKAHPDHNIVIQTHAYLNSNASIGTSNSGYGDNAPTVIQRRLVTPYPQVKLVFSGHVGSFNSRVDTRSDRSVVRSYLGTFHESKDNPLRLLEIDPVRGTVDTVVVRPLSKRAQSGSAARDASLPLVR